MDNDSLGKKVRRAVLGKAKSPHEPGVFHKLSLVAFLAWIGLGADGISSACYGPSEAFQALGSHPHLAVFLALMTALTVFIISASYMQIIELFPTGGGGYLVASKLLSPTVGAVSGCALVVDYVLTIITSIASGADAVFSLLPSHWATLKLPVASAVLIGITVLNLRGVKESVLPIVPVFLLFLVTHAVAIVAGLAIHVTDFPALARDTVQDVHSSVSSLGIFGVGLLLLHAYSLGGGTYTGIEAVSNGLPILREPRVKTGKRTMVYMAVSLAFIAGGLFVGYLVLNLGRPPEGKTLNAVLFENLTRTWPGGGVFVFLALASEALILLVAAQAGFLDGPRVLSNMALDGWMPNRFSLLSDRLVTQNGILLMAGASMVLLWLSKGKVEFLLVLYSINVFVTFSLSQLGMVKHWADVRKTDPRWLRNICINGIGLLLTSTILVATICLKFHEGGWLTLIITGGLVALSIFIKRHYNHTRSLLKDLDEQLADVVEAPGPETLPEPKPRTPFSPPSHEKTAIILVNGFNGLGLHILLNVQRIFRGHFKHFVFIQIGMIDAGQFKGTEEIEHLRAKIEKDLDRYVHFMRSHKLDAVGFHSLGTDVIEEIATLATQVSEHYPNSIVFTGQLVFPNESFVIRFLHNYTAFAIQRRLYRQGTPVFIMPVRVAR